jgi:hypothetical protein
MPGIHETREQWLESATEIMRGWFAAAGYLVPAKVRVSCGFPSVGALSRSKRRIGECWAMECSADSSHEVFVSPTISKPAEVLAVLLHELVHTAVGLRCQHRGPFRKCATALGLVGPMTATSAGPELLARLNGLSAQLGAYPHAELRGAASDRPKKQSTRMLKITCPGCGYTARTTSKWIEVGLPTCCCGEQMQAEGGDGEAGE